MHILFQLSLTQSFKHKYILSAHYVSGAAPTTVHMHREETGPGEHTVRVTQLTRGRAGHPQVWLHRNSALYF